MKNLVRRWLIVGTAIGLSTTTIFFVAYKQHRAAEDYRNHRTAYCSSLALPAEQKKACQEEGKDASDYLGWGYELLRWPAGVEAWAIIGTGIFIGWQSYETRNAAVATKESVAIARKQTEMMRDKERARLEIRAESLCLEVSDSFWYLKGQSGVRNLGPSRAYINHCASDLEWAKQAAEIAPSDFSTRTNMLAESYINETKDSDAPILVDTIFYRTDSVNLDWFAQAAYEGRITIVLRWVIEYETVGTFYRRIYQFEWRGLGSPNSLTGHLVRALPENNTQRVSRGFWRKTRDEEYEIEKPQNPN